MLRHSREDRSWREYPLQLEILTQKLGTMPDFEQAQRVATNPGDQLQARLAQFKL